MKVYERTRVLPSGKVQNKWICDLGIVQGKRKQIYFAVKKDAEAYLKEIRQKRKLEGEAAFALTDQERVTYVHSQKQLAAVGATIQDAVRFYLASHSGVQEEITLAELLNRALLDKELAGKRPKYLTLFGVSNRSFILPRHEQLAHTVTKQDVQKWISGLPIAAKTQRVYLGDVRSLLSWGVNHGHLMVNPAAGKFELKAMDATEIHALTSRQAKALLHAATLLPPMHHRGSAQWERPPLLWMVALGLFAGIRTQELMRLDRSQINLEERHVVVEGRNSKTRQRRVIDLSDNAVQWLALDPLRHGPVVPVNSKLMWGRLRAQAGWRAPVWTFRGSVDGAEKPAPALAEAPEWPHNAMRHTFASMHYAMHQNENLLKAQMGHSKAEDTLMQHYRALKTRREAEEFWSLRPPSMP